MLKSARYAAIETLTRLQRTRTPVSNIFETVAGKIHLASGDRQLAMKIVYGVLRQRDHLDRLLNQLCTRPLGRMKPFVYQALSSGLYQLFFLDRIPVSAAVNETVKAVKAAGFPKQVQGFVNGVLRQSQRCKDELPSPGEPDENNIPPLNHPDWLINRWKSRYGAETMVRICQHNNEEPTLSLRLTSRTNRESYLKLLEAGGIIGVPGSFSADAVIVPEFQGPVTSLPGYERGYFQVQDQAAQLATTLLAPFTANGTYLDCCAGLGGKTTHLASLLDQTNNILTAIEPDSRRFRLLGDNLQRLGHDTVITLQDTLENFASSCASRFNGILLDAPCSGTGIIGRQPDIRWNRQENDLATFQKRQKILLGTAAELLAPGGILVYATCSIEPEENQQVVDSFLSDRNDFSITDCRNYLPETAYEFVRNGYFSPLPADSIDGFFAARLTKTANHD